MKNIRLTQVRDRSVAATEWELRSSAGAVALNNFVVMVDATMKPADARMFRKQVEKHFGLPVKYFILTHHHEDHSLVLGEFKDCCTIASHSATQKIIGRNGTDWREKWKQEKAEDAEWLDEVELLAPELSFHESLVIRDDELSVELRHVGGHSDCSLYAYAPHEKVIFAGDLLFAESFPYAGDPSCNPERWIEIFEEWLALDFEKIVPGHGPVVGRTEVERQLNFFRDLKRATQEAIAAGKGAEDIELPEFYKVPEELRWIETGTLQHFHAFYTAK